MNQVTLRVIIVCEILLGVAAYATGVQLAEWRDAPRQILDQSPDAYRSIAGLQSQWGLLIGCCLGMGVSSAIFAFPQRKQIAASSLMVRAHWLGIILLPLTAFLLFYFV